MVKPRIRNKARSYKLVTDNRKSWHRPIAGSDFFTVNEGCLLLMLIKQHVLHTVQTMFVDNFKKYSLSDRIVNTFCSWHRYSESRWQVLFYKFFFLSVFVMTAVFSTYICQFSAGKSVQIIGNIAYWQHWKTLQPKIYDKLASKKYHKCSSTIPRKCKKNCILEGKRKTQSI